MRLFHWLMVLGVILFGGYHTQVHAATKTPMPFVKSQFFTNAGVPAAGGKVCTFQAGTLTPLATYTDSAGGSANANPIVLDSAGRADIFMSPVSYKIILYAAGGDSNCPNSGSALWTEDNIAGAGAAVTDLGFAPTQGTGLNVNVGAGKALCADRTIYTYAGGTVAATDNATSYVGLRAGCVVGVNTSYGYAGAGFPIATVIASGGVITSITDTRGIYPYPSQLLPYALKGEIIAGTGSNGAVLGFGPGTNGDCIKFNSANTQGLESGNCTDTGFKATAGAGLVLNVGIGKGYCYDGNVRNISSSGQNITLTDNASNYVSFDPLTTGCGTGAINHNTSGYVGFPIAQVTTLAGAITVVADTRSANVAPSRLLGLSSLGDMLATDSSGFIGTVSRGADGTCLTALTASSLGVTWAPCASNATYFSAGTVLSNVHTVIDVCAIGTTCVVTFIGVAAFTSNGTYRCTASDNTAAAAVKANQIDGGHVTFTGTGTDQVSYICVGY